jgi:hypothetical protein
MDREAESRLIAFCVEQHACFDPTAWTHCPAVPPRELAMVTRYLAGVAWYGHGAALRALAAALPESAAELARETSFDASRFAGLLKAHLRHAGRPVAA